MIDEAYHSCEATAVVQKGAQRQAKQWRVRQLRSSCHSLHQPEHRQCLLPVGTALGAGSLWHCGGYLGQIQLRGRVYGRECVPPQCGAKHSASLLAPPRTRRIGIETDAEPCAYI